MEEGYCYFTFSRLVEEAHGGVVGVVSYAEEGEEEEEDGEEREEEEEEEEEEEDEVVTDCLLHGHFGRGGKMTFHLNFGEVSYQFDGKREEMRIFGLFWMGGEEKGDGKGGGKAEGGGWESSPKEGRGDFEKEVLWEGLWGGYVGREKKKVTWKGKEGGPRGVGERGLKKKY